MTTMNTGPTREDKLAALSVIERVRRGEQVPREEKLRALAIKEAVKAAKAPAPSAPVTNWGDAKNAERQNAVADLQRRAFPNGPTQGNPLFGISPNLGTPVEAPPEGTVVERFARGIVNAPLNTAKGVAGLVGDPVARAGIATGILPAEVGTQIDRNQQRFSSEYAPQGVAGAFGSGIGQVATGGIIAKGLGLAAGAGTLAAQGAEAGYQDYRQSVGPEEASTLKGLAVGGGYGLAEYVGERFGLGALLKAGDAQGFKNGVKALLQAAGVNASEEFVTQVAQNAISKTYDPNRQLLQGAGLAAGVGAVAGGVGAAAMRGPNRGGAGQAGVSPPPVVPDQGSQPGAAVTSQQQAATEIPPESSASPLPVRPQAAESAQTLVGDQGQTDQRTAPPQARPVPEATETEAQKAGGSNTLDTPNVDRVSSPNPIQPTPEGESASRSSESLPQFDPRIRPATETQSGQQGLPVQETGTQPPESQPEPPVQSVPPLNRQEVSSPNPTPESGRVGPPPGDVAEPKKPGVNKREDAGTSVNMREPEPQPNTPGFLDAVIAKAEGRKKGRKAKEPEPTPAPSPLPEPATMKPSEMRKELADRGVEGVPPKMTRAALEAAVVNARKFDAGEEQVDFSEKMGAGEKAEPVAETNGAEIPTSPDGVDKYGIYSVNVKGRGVMYAVRESGKQGYGDSIHATADDARNYAEQVKERDQKNAVYREAEATREAAKKATEDARKADEQNLDGFADDAPPLRRGQVAKTLNSLVNIGGKAVSMKEHIRGMVKDGTPELTTREEPRIAPMSRAQFNRADGRQQAAHEKKMRDAGNKTVYRVNGYDLGKTGYDYANHLLSKKNVAPEPAPKPTPSRLESAADATIAAAEARKAERRKTLAEARRKAKPGERPGSSILPDIVDDVVIVAAKAIKAGARTVAQIKQIVREHLGTDNQEVMRRAYRLIRDSQTKDGKHDDARFELAVAELQDKAAETPAPAKATIRENTGQTPNESDTITQREALAGQLKAEAKGAGRMEKIRAAQEKRDAKRLGQAVAIERGAAEQSAAIQAGLAKIDTERKVSAVAEKAKADMKAMREDFADKAAELKAKGELGQDIRRDIVQLAKEYLDPADRGKVLTVIANARAKDPTGKNPSMTRDWFAALNKILGISEDAATRKALKELRKTVGKANAPKSEEATIAKEMLKDLNESLGVSKPVDPFRSGTVRASDVKKLRTEYRDALTPIVDATRNGFSKGANGLADFIQTKTDDGRSNAFDDAGLKLLRSTEGKTLDELNAEQLRVLNDAIKHVAFLSDNDNKMQFLGERRELEQVRAEVVGEVVGRWGDKTATDIGDGSGVGQSIKDLIVTDQDTLSTMIGTVAGRDSIAHKAMYEAIAKGDSDKVRFRRELVKDAQLDKWTPADIANAKKKRDIKLSGGQAKLTGAEMIDIVGLWNDPNTRPEIEKAGLVLEADRGTNDRIFFLNDADVSAIEVAMTPKERAAVDQLQKALKKGYDAANDAHERMNGFRLPDSDKHWSRRRDISATEREVSGELGKNGQAARWIEDSGIFKDRSTSKAAIVVRDALDWVPDQLDTLAGMAHLAIPIREARRIMADPNVKTQFKRKGGANWVKTFENRLSEVSGGMIRDRSSVNSIGQRFLGFTARNKLAWRISTIVKQSLGFLQAAVAAKDKAHKAKIIKQVANAKNYAPSVRKTLREEIDARSGYLAERADPAMSAMLASAANPRLRVAMTKIGRAWQAVERVGMGGMQWADANVVFGTYVATKQHLAKTKGLSGDALKDAAVWETEKIIRDSQNPTSTLDMSGLNLIGRQNSLVGFFTLFTSSSNKVRNQLRQVASDYAADPSKENAARLATTTMLSVGNTVGGRAIGMALSGATISAIMASLTGADLDEREISLFGEAVESGAELMDTFIPYGVAGDTLRWFGGRPTYSLPGGIPNFLTKTQRAIEAIQDDGMDAQTVRNILKAARASQALPDAPIDYAEKIIRGVVGDE